MLRKTAWAAFAAVIGGFASFSSAAISYNAEVTLDADGTFSRAVPCFMQVVTLSTPDVPQVIDSINQFGVRYNNEIAPDSAAMTILFLSDVDESETSVDALINADLHGSVTYPLPAGSFGSFFLTDLPVNVSVPGNKVGVAVFMTNSDGTEFNLDLAGRLTTGSPSVGGNDGFIYLDQNSDGIFDGTERFQEIGNSLNLAPTNLRMIMSSTVPEPSTIALLAPLTLTLRRRPARRI